MDIVSILSDKHYKNKLLTLSFNKVGFLIEMINKLNKIVKDDSCPMITNEEFIFSLFLPCVKKYVLDKPVVTGGKRLCTYKKKNKKNKKKKYTKKYTKKYKGGNKPEWQIIISFFFLLMSLLTTTTGQLQINTDEYKTWKQTLIKTRYTDVLQNNLGLCSIDAYAVGGFFPITQYKRIVELQLGITAYDFYEYHPQKDDEIPMRHIQRYEVEEAANINIEMYRINIPMNAQIDAYTIHERILEGFSRRFQHITPGSYIIGTFGYTDKNLDEFNERERHAANIVYTKILGGEPLLEIIDLSEDDISIELNPLQAIEYINRKVYLGHGIDIYFSKQQSLTNIPISFKESINMTEVEDSVIMLSDFPKLQIADETINAEYTNLKNYLITNNTKYNYSNSDKGEILSRILGLKYDINNLLIQEFGSLQQAYPFLQKPLHKSIKTYVKPKSVIFF